MFQRARRRLTLQYIAIFALVLAVFSLVFYVAFRAVLGPAFDIAPDLSTAQAADQAYRVTLERVAIALVVANVVTVAAVGSLAWVLANRTLRPIRDALLRQRRFVADASHEMRTPLAAIRATAESSLGPSADPAAARPNLSAILSSAEQLTSITNDLLLLARADDRMLDPPTEPFDLSVVVAEAIATFRLAKPEARPARVTLAPDLQVTGTPASAERIVTNLLDNAFRYGGLNVSVTVTTGSTERDAMVEVNDDGPGMAPADLERIFEPFHRIRADGEGPPGNGLGLAIARSLAERAGGRLTASSEIGLGSSFRLTMPRRRQRPSS
jgi:signal transduction histidine kinase